MFSIMFLVLSLLTTATKSSRAATYWASAYYSFFFFCWRRVLPIKEVAWDMFWDCYFCWKALVSSLWRSLLPLRVLTRILSFWRSLCATLRVVLAASWKVLFYLLISYINIWNNITFYYCFWSNQSTNLSLIYYWFDLLGLSYSSIVLNSTFF